MDNKISLCMIVKDEEENLPRCLESVKDLVDEMIIVDTGSTDGTVEIARRYGAKVYYFKWCNDFSAARNESLKYATKEWILIMDADDELCIEDKEKFKMVTENFDKNAFYVFETLCYFGAGKGSDFTINLNPRLFKNNHEYYYEGAVHNQLVNLKHPVRGVYETIRIFHYGYLDSIMASKNKNKRNITLLEEQIKKEPQNKFHYFNLGNEYFSLDDKEKALEFYYKAYENFDPKSGFGPKLIERIVLANNYFRKNNKALEFVENGLKYYPEFTDLYYLKGLILNEENKLTLAIKAFEKCIELGEPPALLKSIYGTGGFRATYELAQIYMKLKDYDTAYEYCIDTIRLKSDYLVPLYNIAHILKLKETPLDEFKKHIENFFTDFPREYPIVADLFYTEGYYEPALEYLEKYQIKNELSENLKFLKIKCLLRTAKIEECIQYIDSINEDNLYYFQIMMYKIICLVIINKYQSAVSILSEFDENELSDYNKKMLQIYEQFIKLFIKESTAVVSEDENEKEYTAMILEICEILLINEKFDEYERAVTLFNLISDKSVLLLLGKLYFKQGYVDMAKKEIIRSIKEFEVFDREGLDILRW